MRRIICFVFVALAIATRVDAAEPTPIHVPIIQDHRVSSLSDAQTHQVLDRTEHLIKTVCHRDVRFVIDHRVESIPFFDSLAARIAPYDPAKADTINPFAADRNAWRKPIRQSLDRVADLNTIRQMVSGHPDMPTIDDVADALCGLYAKSIDQLKTLKADDGSALLTTDN